MIIDTIFSAEWSDTKLVLIERPVLESQVVGL